ncbi:MAG: DUF1287 domain-containing protein [Hyphomicrobiales bacterium]|nr:DUF1287 domain-containing protein [Hyphomicrobiales bacterium]
MRSKRLNSGSFLYLSSRTYLDAVEICQRGVQLRTRRFLLGGIAVTGSVTAFSFCWLLSALANPGRLPASDWAKRLIAAAEIQIGETVIYDPAYAGLKYPGGDIPRERGVCTDVVIRAYRDAFDIDLQQLVHEDMRRAFGTYPKIWGLKRPDRNIDHRRVPNLETFFARSGAKIASSSDAADFLTGDLVAQMLPGNLPHVAIISDKLATDGVTPLVIHNIGAGTRLENRLFDFKHTGHFRFPPPA